MWSSVQEYHRPATIRSALRLLGRVRPYTVPLAGGTWLVARSDPAIEALVDLSALGLDYVNVKNWQLRLGAMTRLQTLATHPVIQNFAGGLLGNAVKKTAPRSVRNAATLGGTLITSGSTSDLILALLVLDAKVVLRLPTRRLVPLEVFLADRQIHLLSGSLLVEEVLPAPPQRSGTSASEIRCTPGDIPIVNAAALVSRKGDRCRVVRLALGGVSTVPIRLPDVETILTGRVLDDDLLHQIADHISASVNPQSDDRASSDYRRFIAGITACRAIQQAYNNTVDPKAEE